MGPGADPVAVLSEAWVLSSRPLDRDFNSRLRHGYLFLISLYCAVLCTYRPGEELIPRPRSPVVCRTLIKKPSSWLCAPQGVTETYAHCPQTIPNLE